MNEIYIVATQKLSNYARKLVHNISKSGLAKSSFYTPEKFRDNESSFSGLNKVIFIGENEVSKDFIPLIDIKYDVFGAQWGYDFTKAIILAGESNASENELKLELEDVNNKKKVLTKKSKKSIDLKIWEYFYLLPLVPFVIPFLLSEEKRIKRLKYELAIASFLEIGLSDFVKVSEK